MSCRRVMSFSRGSSGRGPEPPRRLINYRKLESFHPDGPMFRSPVVGAAPRLFQGLDLKKVVTMPVVPLWRTREKYHHGYKYPERNSQPSVNAMTPEEVVTYYDNTMYHSKFSNGELVRAYCMRFLRMYLHGISILAIVGSCMLLYFIPSNRLEAIEYYMNNDEYYENYKWHDFGKFIDKKAYENYLEARRAKLWGRQPHVDPIDYIPAQYRSTQQRIDRGEISAPEGDTTAHFEEEDNDD